ncbi:retrovirus-related Pol polyprotein from transposon TNT 1-94 [Trichonephila clavipes]|nr:retrovirus-related Pol polyprotein from transposon TNT 1-94 [Trichonephila clavipes]
MKNGQPVGDYIARARGISTKCHSLGLDVSPRELVYHTVRGLNGKLSKVRDILKTQRGKTKYENLTDKSIKKITTDSGLEFVNEQLDTYLVNSGIFHEKTIPYNSESNGKAERANRVLLERAKSLLYENKLSLKFWAEAINCSTQVSNITPRKGKEKNPLRNLDSSKRLVFLSTGTSRTLDSQTPGSRTAVHVLMGEKEKIVWSVVILLKQRNSSSVL